ncbi:MAG: tRNA uridine-5-carboxymethylaminomethyl(34) synthesis GTPase MnmE [Pseudomonadota bacterium]
MSADDTICALASGPPPSAIAIVRVSGPAVSTIMADLVAGPPPPPRRASLRDLSDSGTLIDRGVVVFMPAPDSYTGEDTLEFQIHGGAGVIEHLLTALTKPGRARLAEPGEFTRRAFESGKLDLLQAEAVADLIEAETQAQKDQALRQVDGVLSETYEAWRRTLTEILAGLEATIDFPDEDDAPSEVGGETGKRMSDLIADMQAALGDGGIGERLRDGFRVAIVGPPNAGKSTLINRLSGRDVAIVADRPGTTRDALEARMRIGGAMTWLVDTAGMRASTDEIEAEGVRRAEAQARDADLRIHVVDATDPDWDLVAAFHVKHDLVLANKSDLASVARKGVFALSALTGQGEDDLRRRLTDWVAAQARHAESSVITRARHRQAIRDAVARLEAGIDNLRNHRGAEFVAEDVRLAARSIGGVVGDVGVEEVLGTVFSSFCIGK